ncbi:MAG: hypothetical protein MUC96_23775 [Myxococcaceae bacterium]|jgi:hypothetical protein|nr:hypothetical protein [Myxococcaceae bacterium]
MNIVAVYARIYAKAFTDALAAIAKNPWTLLLPMGIAVAGLVLVLLVFTVLGSLIGGFLAGLAQSAALSVYCFFLGGLVANQKVGLDQLKTSIGAYFWSWISIFFVLWIARILLGPVFASNVGIARAYDFVLIAALNAVPEVIYQKGTRGGLETIGRNFSFLQENPIEWFLPNAPLLAVVYAAQLFSVLSLTPLGIGGALVAGILLHVAMVFRGFLFEALDGSTHRQRMFRFRNG